MKTELKTFGMFGRNEAPVPCRASRSWSTRATPPPWSRCGSGSATWSGPIEAVYSFPLDEAAPTAAS
ncbi:MAG: hypothetical protein IPH09_12815 [bacterium]|nr:hypothetical protein [bacterium]